MVAEHGERLTCGTATPLSIPGHRKPSSLTREEGGPEWQGPQLAREEDDSSDDYTTRVLTIGKVVVVAFLFHTVFFCPQFRN
jgi:hypothetical protein